MYTPSKFGVPDRSAAVALIQAFPFATLISQGGSGLSVNHFPLFAEERDGELWLLGHLARANPQWRDFATGPATAIFNGPHTYISPSFYRKPLHVPTWNYAVVHATGPVKILADPEPILVKSVNAFEALEPTPWHYELPEDFRAGLVKAIVGFEIRVEKLEAKFKLSQNRDADDYAGVLEGLARRTDENSRQTLELMRKHPSRDG